MANLQKILEQQKEVGQRLVEIRDKLNDGKRLAATLRIGESLDELYYTFEENHKNLLQSSSRSDDYFANKYYESLKTVMSEIEFLRGRDKQSTKNPLTEPSQESLLSLSRKEVSAMDKSINFTAGNSEREADDTKSKDKNECKWRGIFFMKSARTLNRTEETSFKDIMSIEKVYNEVEYYYEKLTSIDACDLEIETRWEDTKEYLDCQKDKIMNKSNPPIMPKTAEISQSHVRLADIKIPEFSGNIDEWESFHDLFKSLVHDSPHFKDVEKMFQLKTSLKGEARQMLQHLKVTEANYIVAFEILKNRYENRRLLFTKLVDTILDQPVLNSDSADSIKQMLDTTNNAMQSLISMDIGTSEAAPFIARILVRKFDKNGLRLYERQVRKPKEIQQLDDVLEFLEQQYLALEAANEQGHGEKKIIKKYETFGQRCDFCEKLGHQTTDCRKLLALSAGDRRSKLIGKRICFCLGHKTDRKCNNGARCKKCDGRHHTLLHMENYRHQDNQKHDNKNLPSTNKAALVTEDSTKPVLLATAQVKVRSVSGELMLMRALLDQGSQITSISEEAAQILGLPRIRNKTEIHGLGSALVGVSKSKLELEIKPRFASNETFRTQALVLPTVMSAQPSESFQMNNEDLNKLVLADPLFNKSDRVDIIIGSDIYADIMEEGQIKGNGPFAQQTKLGWILSGKVDVKNKKRKLHAAVTNLERFWELEEVDMLGEEAADDQWCMANYDSTTRVEDNFRIVVSLPLKDDTKLGESKPQAMARFLAGERRTEGNPELKKQYVAFMNEYEQLGHMVEVPTTIKGKYYLPHQAVVREGSLTTKVRVVFDASAKSSNGMSLNDIMYTGPKLQKDIFDIILKWRLWKYVVTADVEKMYRQIQVEADNQEYQFILWREKKSDTIKQYKLTTVTYGTSAAPFLAVRTLFYIADSHSNNDVKKVIKEDFYMDDLMTGADTRDNCNFIMTEVATHLRKYNFNLRKWLSNDRKILTNVHDKGNNEVINIKDDESIKTLGVLWDPVRDEFSFNINLGFVSSITKRKLLSAVARIFDPLGWLAPVTIVAKLIIQKLWLLQSPWDEAVPMEISHEWQHFTETLSTLRLIRIPRWVLTTTDQIFEIHGFADASEKAYAAVVYIKCNGEVTLYTAKTKVNPIKNRKTLPKLELCAAHLLVRLLKKIWGIINRESTIFAWSDSTIALGWINKNRNSDKFIRNRVNEMTTMLPSLKWNYVNTKENPADVASRGIQSKDLKGFKLWWNGPEWLLKNSDQWPTLQQRIQQARVTTAATYNKNHFLDTLLEKYSSFSKLIRVVAYIQRFVKAVKGDSSRAEILTVEELTNAEILIIKRHQEMEFKQELNELNSNSRVGSKSCIISLYPFIDKEGIMRVGGRLQNSDMHFNQRHPIILQKSHLANLLVQRYHAMTLHGGNRLTEVSIRRKYWIIGMKKIIKKYIRSCPKCIRYKQETANQIMGSLPEPRVLASHPFMHTGVDYAGPLLIKCSKGRGQKSYKGYISVFVCMATRAIHLEAVSDLTTDAFIAALKRFFARRGKSAHMYSDNGTNFVGARRKLDCDFEVAVRNNKSITSFLTEEKVRWHYIPPASPHHGGIWEAGVKSVKHHLKRVIGDTKLTYEELSTLLCQIESVLNSRPLLYYDNEDIETLEVLSPGHFLIGRPVIDVPEHVSEPVGCLNRWKLIQKMKRDFWNRWKGEYLNLMQQRRKWVQPEDNLKEGDVVIVKEETTHPAKWPLGRIDSAVKGKDGKVRVVSVRLQTGIIKRPVQKVCPLLKAEDEKSDTSPIKEKTHRGNPAVGMFLALLLLASVKRGNAFVSGNTVSNLNSSTAIYLDNVGSVEVVSSTWNIVVFYNMGSFFEVIRRSEIVVKDMRTTCEKLQDFETQCNNVLDSLERMVLNMKRTNQYLFPDKTSRVKRAPLEFIGSLQHILFGTMDAEDRKQMELNMEAILDNQHDLQFLVKKQTSVVESTINVLTRSTKEVNLHFKSITDRLNNMTEAMKNSYLVYRESIKFFMVTKELEILMAENERVQSQVVELLIDINHGKLNPDLLTPIQLQDEITRIREHIPEHLRLPGRGTNTLNSIYKLLTAKASIIENKLVMSVSIPLFNDHASQLHRIIPIPFIYKGVKVMATTRNHFLIYNFNGDTYHLMSQADLNQCQRFSEDEFVCDGGWPWMDANDNSCEVSSIKPLNNHRCQFTATQLESLWVKLQKTNNWLFSSFNTTTAHIQCQPERQKLLKMPKQGIISLDSGCTLRMKGAIISAPYQLKSQRSREDKVILSTNVLSIEEFNVPALGSMTINHTAAINLLKKQIDELKEKDVHLRALHFHKAHGSISLVLIILCLIIALIFYIRFKCKTKTTSVKIDFTPPAPLGATQ